MDRPNQIARLRDRGTPWDFVVIGGGATGIGVAVDAAARGYDVVLLEQSDFGKGTSSRSTKLVHGGVRYLQQGHVGLVRRALHERARLRQLAPHVVSDLPFVLPSYSWWQRPFYGSGLKLYDLLASGSGFGRSRWLSREQTIRSLPTLRRDKLRGGVRYHDGQFDDARLLVFLMRTAQRLGALMLNYLRVEAFRTEGGRIRGVRWVDDETGEAGECLGRVVVNAAGPFADAVLDLEETHRQPLIAPSQGVHLVVPRSFLPTDSALLVPRTTDGRVMFAIPFLGSVVLGTTDTPVPKSSLEPRPLPQEIDFILETAAGYLDPAPQRSDVRAAFAGIRPLVRASSNSQSTASLSRDHSILVSRHGLVTIVGGKWTTYRHMAEDCVTTAAQRAGLDPRPCRTESLRIHGYTEVTLDDLALRFPALRRYGGDLSEVVEVCEQTPGGTERLHPDYPYLAGETVWAARHEAARTVDDVLARRTRLLTLDAAAACQAAPRVATLLANEFDRDEAWQRRQVEQFLLLAENYRV